MYVVSITPRNVPLRNVMARQLSNVLQWNLPIVDMLEVVIILYIYIHNIMYMCVSIEAADVCLQYGAYSIATR